MPRHDYLGILPLQLHLLVRRPINRKKDEPHVPRNPLQLGRARRRPRLRHEHHKKPDRHGVVHRVGPRPPHHPPYRRSFRPETGLHDIDGMRDCGLWGCVAVHECVLYDSAFLLEWHICGDKDEYGLCVYDGVCPVVESGLGRNDPS